VGVKIAKLKILKKMTFILRQRVLDVLSLVVSQFPDNGAEISPFRNARSALPVLSPTTLFLIFGWHCNNAPILSGSVYMYIIYLQATGLPVIYLYLTVEEMALPILTKFDK